MSGIDENTNLRTLDYAGSVRPRRPNRLRFTIAAGLGAAGSFGLAYFTYTPLLRFLARGVVVFITAPDGAFDSWIQYHLAVAMGGAVVGVSTAAASWWVGRRSGVFWTVLFTGIFFGAALLRVLDIHAQMSALIHAQAEISKFSGGARISATFRPAIPLESVSVCTVPMVGSIAVVIALAVLIAPGMIGRAMRPTQPKAD